MVTGQTCNHITATWETHDYHMTGLWQSQDHVIYGESVMLTLESQVHITW